MGITRSMTSVVLAEDVHIFYSITECFSGVSSFALFACLSDAFSIAMHCHALVLNWSSTSGARSRSVL
jgi:hypothetical protein